MKTIAIVLGAFCIIEAAIIFFMLYLQNKFMNGVSLFEAEEGSFDD